MAGPVRIAILANASQAKRELGSIESRASRMGSVLKRTAAVGAGLAGAALLKFGVNSAKAASSAEQSIGATESVFGKYADTVIDRSNKAAEAIGLSANEYRELSNVTGAMLQSAGTPLRKVTGLTDQLTKRAADMAATFGGTTREAVEAVSALLRGETDPIERYGVSIRQSDISARLAAKGLDGLTGSALKQAEQQERLGLLFDQTARTSGQFARESDTAAGASQRLSAKFENLQARAGKLLLPALVRLADYADDTLLPAAERMLGWLEDNSDEMSAFGATVKDSVVPPLKTLAEIAKQVAGVLGDLPDPLQKMAIQGGLAAAVLPRLNGAAGVASGAIGTLTAKAKQNYAEMTYATSRADKFRNALSGLGGAARGAAGVAGLVALTSAAGEADSGLRTLSNVGGGALLGFSAAGPIGGAVGATAGILLTLKQRADAASEAADKGMGSWKNYAATLDGVTGSATQATRAMVLQNLTESGALSTLREYGVTTREAVDAMLGRASAGRQVDAAVSNERSSLVDLRSEYGALRDEIRDAENAGGTVASSSRERLEALGKEIDTRQKAVDAIANERGETEKAIAAKRREIAATTDYAGKLKGLPRSVKTVVSEQGVLPTTRAVAKLARQYNLSPKQVRTLIKATGIDATVKDVRRVEKRLKGVERVRPNLRPYAGTVRSATQLAAINADRGSGRVIRGLNRVNRARPNLGPWATVLGAGVRNAGRNADRGVDGINRSLSRGTSRARPDLRGFTSVFGRSITAVERNAGRGGGDISNILRQTTGRARPDLGGFNSGVASGIGSARGIASSGGLGVGSALKSGVINGFAGTSAALASSAFSAVRNAIAAARAAARAKSPSRETMKLGKDMGDGLRIGFEREGKKVNKAAQKVIKKLLGAAKNDLRSVSEQLRNLGMSNKGGRKGDALEKYQKRVNSVADGLKKLNKRLVTNANNQEKVNAKLGNARTKLKELIQARDEYARGIRDSFTNFGSVAGIEEGHLNAPETLLAQLREQAARADRFDAAIRALRGTGGLNQTTLKQLLEAGPDAGLAAAEALVAGGAGTIAEVNALTQKIAAQGQALGDRMSKDFNQAGVNAQAGLVKGLEKNAGKAEATGRRLANRILRAFKKRLGIKSPSTEFALAGRQVVEGLQIGVDDPRVQAAGKKLAEGLRTGFGKPALSAKASAPAAGARGNPIRVRVEITPNEAIDAVAAGRRIVKYVDAFEDSQTGGRRNR